MSHKPVQTNQAEFPEDYHEYVFKDGKLLGRFDDMYRHAKGIPWDQDKHCGRWYTEVGMLMLKDQAPYATVLEIGCGVVIASPETLMAYFNTYRPLYSALLRNHPLVKDGPILHFLAVKTE